MFLQNKIYRNKIYRKENVVKDTHSFITKIKFKLSIKK